MADISELLIEVKQINKTIGDIDLVNKKLKQTQATATSLGKSLFAGASFTALIASVKKFGDAWKQVIVTNKAFGTMFKKNIDIANKGVKELTKNFNETNVSAKKLLSTIKSRFGFDLISSKKTAEMATNMARLSHEVAAFYGTDVAAVSEKFNMALNGSSRALREFGINIDLNSPRMKKMIEEMRIAEGETEEGAKALVIYNEILKRGQKYEGSFKTQAKTLSQAFGDIGNTLKSGMFAEAGRVLSAIFVPILEKINALLSQPWVQKIGGIALALGSIVGVIKSIQLAVAGLNATLLRFNIAVPQFLTTFNSLLGAFFNTIGTFVVLNLKKIKNSFLLTIGALSKKHVIFHRDILKRAGKLQDLMRKAYADGNEKLVKRIGEIFSKYGGLRLPKIDLFGKAEVDWLLRFAKFKDVLNGSVRSIGSIFSRISTSVGSSFKSLSLILDQSITNYFRGVKKVSPQVEAATQTFIKKYIDSANKLKLQMSMASSAAEREVLKKKSSSLASGFASGLASSVGRSTGLGSKLKGVWEGIKKSLGWIITGVGSFFRGFGKTFLKLVKNPYVAAITAIVAALATLFVFTFKSFAKSNKIVPEDAGEYLKMSVSQRWGIIWDNLWHYLLELFYYIPESIAKFFTADFWKSIASAFSGFGERLLNFMLGQGFNTDEQVLKKFEDTQLKRVNDYKKTIDDLIQNLNDFWHDESVSNLDPKIVLKIEKARLKSYEKQREDEKRNLAALQRAAQRWSAIVEERKKQGKSLSDIETKAMDRNKEAIKKSLGRIKALKDLMDKTNGNIQKAQGDVDAAAQKQQELLRKNKENLLKMMEAQKTVLSSRFEGFTWYQDIQEKILEGLGQLTDSKKLKNIRERMDELDKMYLDPRGKFWSQYNNKEKIEYYKKLTDLELSAYQIKLNIVNKEREALQKTNEIVQDALNKAMEWKPRGVEGMEAGTAEGYKYLTSGLGNLASIQSVMSQNQNDEKNLQMQSNNLVSSIKGYVKAMNSKIQTLQFNENQVLLKTVNNP